MANGEGDSGKERGDTPLSTCEGTCQVQEYRVTPIKDPGRVDPRKTEIGISFSLAYHSQMCPSPTDAEVLDMLKAVQTNKVIQPCPDKRCLCTPRNVPANDPSWSKPVKYRLPRQLKFDFTLPAKGDLPEQECYWVISGWVYIEERQDLQAVCMTDPRH